MMGHILMTPEFVRAERRRLAACRAVGIVNKLRPGQFKKNHASRVFTNLNYLRTYARMVKHATRIESERQSGAIDRGGFPAHECKSHARIACAVA